MLSFKSCSLLSPWRKTVKRKKERKNERKKERKKRKKERGKRRKVELLPLKLINTLPMAFFFMFFLSAVRMRRKTRMRKAYANYKVP